MIGENRENHSEKYARRYGRNLGKETEELRAEIALLRAVVPKAEGSNSPCKP